MSSIHPDDQVRVTRGEHAGYYRVLDIDDRAGETVLRLLPERAWSIADPVERRHHVIALGHKHPERIFHKVPEHAPVCRSCGDMWPCQHVRDSEKIDAAFREIQNEENKRQQAREARKKARARYSMPGFCPACRKPVTTGQPSQTFETNAVIKNGPPVTFHVSRQCGIDTRHHSMNDYQKRLQKEKTNR